MNTRNRLYNPGNRRYGLIEIEEDKSKPFCILCGKTYSNEALKRVHSEHMDNVEDFFE